MCRESTGCAASSAGKQSLWDVQWLVFFGQKTLTLAVLGGFGLWQLSENAGREGISFQWCHPLSCVGYSSTFFVEIQWFGSLGLLKEKMCPLPFFPIFSKFKHDLLRSLVRQLVNSPVVRHRSKTLRLKMRSRPPKHPRVADFGWLSGVFFNHFYLRKIGYWTKMKPIWGIYNMGVS